jgi:biopolymer transport protein ExbD
MKKMIISLLIIFGISASTFANQIPTSENSQQARSQQEKQSVTHSLSDDDMIAIANYIEYRFAKEKETKSIFSSKNINTVVNFLLTAVVAGTLTHIGSEFAKYITNKLIK